MARGKDQPPDVHVLHGHAAALGAGALCATVASCALVYPDLFEYHGMGGAGGAGLSGPAATASSSSGKASWSGLGGEGGVASPLDASSDAPNDGGPCGPWTDNAVCHQGPPPFTLNCSIKSNCAGFANCQQYDCVQSTCCFWIINGAPATCGSPTCTVDSDCGVDSGPASPCVALSCVNGECVGTFTGQCCSP